MDLAPSSQDHLAPAPAASRSRRSPRRARKMIELKKVAVVGNYPPLKCGIATFTNDLHASLRSALPGSDCSVVALSELGRHACPPEVRFEISRDDPRSYRRAAEYLNFNEPSVVSVQHEFGIYGGP